ncbi:hypothetical protein GPK77_15095 [Butyricicoccus faecihominis]|nr:hypothetical protein [Butyricicoccus faecihominis]
MPTFLAVVLNFCFASAAFCKRSCSNNCSCCAFSAKAASYCVKWSCSLPESFTFSKS